MIGKYISGLKRGPLGGDVAGDVNLEYKVYFPPQEIPCGAPDGYPPILIQEVHRYYGSGVRAVDVLCNM